MRREGDARSKAGMTSRLNNLNVVNQRCPLGGGHDKKTFIKILQRNSRKNIPQKRVK